MLRRRSVTETFCMETFCRGDVSCGDVLYDQCCGAPAPGKFFDAAPAALAPAPTLLYSNELKFKHMLKV
jgi:hypothetical protein